MNELLAKLGVNVTAKRHAFSGKWDMRAYHPWGKDCLCSVAQKDTVAEAWEEMEKRLPDILARNEKSLMAINKRRAEHFAKQSEEQEPTNFWEDWN